MPKQKESVNARQTRDNERPCSRDMKKRKGVVFWQGDQIYDWYTRAVPATQRVRGEAT
jgi:hypothetical protein